MNQENNVKVVLFFYAQTKKKGQKLMADELELVMDIETLEIFEVISSDDNSKDLSPSEETVEEQVLTSKSYHTNVVQLTLFDAVNLASFEESS